MLMVSVPSRSQQSLIPIRFLVVLTIFYVVFRLAVTLFLWITFYKMEIPYWEAIWIDRWDQQYYMAIAESGYLNNPYGLRVLAFPPLWGWMIRAMNMVTGNSIVSGFLLYQLIGALMPVVSYFAGAVLVQEEALRKKAALIFLTVPTAFLMSFTLMSEYLTYFGILLVIAMQKPDAAPRESTLAAVIRSPIGRFLIEIIGLLIMTARFDSVLFASYYLTRIILRALASSGEQKFRTVLQGSIQEIIWILFLCGTYLGWNLYLSVTFGMDSTDARWQFWGHGFGIGLNPWEQLGHVAVAMLAGLVGGILLWKTMRRETTIHRETTLQRETTMQRGDTTEALSVENIIFGIMAWGSVTIFIYGCLNSNSSYYRYFGQLVPIIVGFIISSNPKWRPWAAIGAGLWLYWMVWNWIAYFQYFHLPILPLIVYCAIIAWFGIIYITGSYARLGVKWLWFANFTGAAIVVGLYFQFHIQ